MTKLTLSLLLGFLVIPATGQPTEKLAFDHLAIVDVATGSVSSDMLVVVEEGRITAVIESTAAGTPPGATVVDAAGKYMIPGLWDMHVHIADRAYLPQFIAHGVTGVRDMGGGLNMATDGG